MFFLWRWLLIVNLQQFLTAQWLVFVSIWKAPVVCNGDYIASKQIQNHNGPTQLSSHNVLIVTATPCSLV